jgi:hypothetical protein
MITATRVLRSFRVARWSAFVNPARALAILAFTALSVHVIQRPSQNALPVIPTLALLASMLLESLWPARFGKEVGHLAIVAVVWALVAYDTTIHRGFDDPLWWMSLVMACSYGVQAVLRSIRGTGR